MLNSQFQIASQVSGGFVISGVNKSFTLSFRTKGAPKSRNLARVSSYLEEFSVVGGCDSARN